MIFRPIPKSALLLCLLGTLALVGCGAGELDRNSTASGTFADESKAIEEARAEAHKYLGTEGDKVRALWDRKSDGAEWSREVLEEVRSRSEIFDSAKDINDFCPSYAVASSFQKESCWLRIVSAMARYESSFRPRATYIESSGATSVGLLMMNPEHCPGANTLEQQQSASANIRCALARMSLLIKRDGYISGPAEAKGAAAYWSVLRSPYRFQNLFLGRKPQIQEFTRSYAAFSELSLKMDSDNWSED